MQLAFERAWYNLVLLAAVNVLLERVVVWVGCAAVDARV